MDVIQEHGVLLRMWAGLQHRLAQQQHQHDLAMDALHTEVMRLRGRLVLAHTAALWSLGNAVPRPSRLKLEPEGALLPAPLGQPVRVLASAMNESHAVMCRTGCQGHAHPWLAVDGQCGRTGQACDSVAVGVHESMAAPLGFQVQPEKASLGKSKKR